MSIPSAVDVAVGDVVSCGTGYQISPNLRVLTGLRPPSVTLSLSCWITCGSVAANISALPLSGLPHRWGGGHPLAKCLGHQPLQNYKCHSAEIPNWTFGFENFGESGGGGGFGVWIQTSRPPWANPHTVPNLPHLHRRWGHCVVAHCSGFQRLRVAGGRRPGAGVARHGRQRVGRRCHAGGSPRRQWVDAGSHAPCGRLQTAVANVCLSRRGCPLGIRCLGNGGKSPAFPWSSIPKGC